MPDIKQAKSDYFKKHYGPWAVVAGASQGLGAAYARQLAERGINLFLIARQADLVAHVAADLSQQYAIQAASLAFDLSSPDAADRIAQNTEGLDVGLLVYNAAFSAVGPFLDRPVTDHLKEIDTNVRTPLLLTYTFGERMLKNGHGGLILMSSLSAFQGSAYISNYSATKAYNMLLAEGLWGEWRPRGVDVLVCVAGAISTPNFIASTPTRTGRVSDASQPPEAVAREAIAALGRQPFVIPGSGNRLASFMMRHLLPRKMAIQMMGRILRGMYIK